MIAAKVCACGTDRLWPDARSAVSRQVLLEYHTTRGSAPYEFLAKVEFKEIGLDKMLVALCLTTPSAGIEKHQMFQKPSTKRRLAPAQHHTCRIEFEHGLEVATPAEGPPHKLCGDLTGTAVARLPFLLLLSPAGNGAIRVEVNRIGLRGPITEELPQIPVEASLPSILDIDAGLCKSAGKRASCQPRKPPAQEGQRGSGMAYQTHQ